MELHLFDNLQVPIFELKQLVNLEDFTVNKDKMQMPRNGQSNKGMFVCFLNTSLESIAMLLNNKHPRIVNMGTAYKGYYYDFRSVRFSIKSTRIKNPGKTNITLKKERLHDYGQIQQAAPNIITPISVATLAGKNFVYDMEPITRLLRFQPKLVKLPLLERLRTYFRTIGSYYNGLNIDGYEKGPIFINLDDCNNQIDLQQFYFYQYMMLLLKKSDNVIYKVMMDVPNFQFLLYTSKGYILMSTEDDFKRENYIQLVNFVKRIKPNFTSADEKEYDEIIQKDFDNAVVQKLKQITTGIPKVVSTVQKTEKLITVKKTNAQERYIKAMRKVMAKRALGKTPKEEIINMSEELETPQVKDTEDLASEITTQKKVQRVKDIEAEKEEAEIEKKKQEKQQLAEDKTQFALDADNIDEAIVEDEAIDDTIEELEVDDQLKSTYLKGVIDKRAGTKSAVSIKRDKLLRERQMQLKLHDKTIGELVTEIPEPPDIPELVIDTDVTTNEAMKKVRFYNFEKVYVDELFDRDMARAITAFNDKGINVNVIKVDVEDTSTELVYQDTYTIQLEDENRKRHTIKVNIPKLVDDKFLIINGKKRVIQKQLVGLPIIKTGRDELQIISNYNKIWMERHGSRFNPNMERLKRLLVDETKRPDHVKIRVYKGDNSVINNPYATCLEYDELGSLYNKIVINDCTFIFSVDMLKDELGSKYKEPTLDEIIIGYKGKDKTPIVYHTSNSDHQDMVSLIIQESMPVYYDEFKKLSSGRKYIHNNVKMMEKKFPLVFALCFFEGLTTVVQKFNNLAGSTRVTLVDKKDKNDNFMYIQFKDAYLKYAMNDLEACLLFNGFTELELKDFTVNDMDTRDTYITIFEQLLGNGYFAGGIINFYDFMIDYKTLDLLKLLGYPEDLVSLMIFASNMLADSDFAVQIDPKLYRLRNVEIIPAILYKELTTAYSRYRKTANNANPAKISIDPDCVIKQLAALPTVESYSTLSPVNEVKTFGMASMAGYRGMNSERAYTEDKRNYHDDMIGIIGVSTDISGNCGKERHLVVEPNVMNAYGMFDLVGRDKAEELDATKLMTTEEMLYPMGIPHDDPNRSAMTSKQSCHAIPVMEQSPLLITNGFDSTIQYRTSSDFSVVAEQDGVVIEKNEKVNIMVVKYKDGTIKAIDLDKKIVQNGGGGFYLDNKLDTTFKKGDKFRQGAILAFDRHYFKDTGMLGNKLTYGTKVKAACLSNMATYEDSMWSTYRLSRSMSTDITMKEVSVVIGKNSEVDFYAKVGDHIHNGDDLIRFDTSYSEAEMSELMHSIRQDLQEDVVNLGRSKFTSKHDGIVADIRVYPAVELTELSPSLRKMVNDIQKHDRDRRSFMDKYDKNSKSVYRKGIFFKDTVGMVKPDQYGKIAGVDVQDGVLVEIFVTYHDEVSDGETNVITA